MNKYDYLEAVKKDVKKWTDGNDWKLDIEWTREEIEEYLNDVLWAEDSVTGNASGSYTFSRWEAEENLCHNFDLLEEISYEFGYDEKNWLENPEGCDVTIRCYLLGQAIGEILDEMGVY